MGDTAELRFQITYRSIDLYKAAFVYSMRRLRFWTPVLGTFGGFLIIAGLNYRRSDSLQPTFVLLGVALSTLAGLVLSALLVLLQTRSFTKYPGILSPIWFSFSSSGVVSELVHQKSSADWSLMTGAVESAEFIFIGMQRGTYYVIPKAQLTADQVVRLKDILRRYVAKNIRLRQ